MAKKDRLQQEGENSSPSSKYPTIKLLVSIFSFTASTILLVLNLKSTLPVWTILISCLATISVIVTALAIHFESRFGANGPFHTVLSILQSVIVATLWKLFDSKGWLIAIAFLQIKVISQDLSIKSQSLRMALCISCLIADYHEPMTYLAIILANTDAMLDLARYFVDMSKKEGKQAYFSRSDSLFNNKHNLKTSKSQQELTVLNTKVNQDQEMGSNEQSNFSKRIFIIP